MCVWMVVMILKWLLSVLTQCTTLYMVLKEGKYAEIYCFEWLYQSCLDKEKAVLYHRVSTKGSGLVN